jgi:SAM-dependent methyltransferase
MSQERFWEQWDPVATSMDAYWADTPVEDWYRKTAAAVIIPFIKNESFRYLDVGCGNGLLFKELVAGGVSPKSLIGVDNSPKMIELARKRASGGIFGLGDLFGLAYPDRSIDVVGVLNLLSHIPDLKVGLKEAWRVASKAVFFTAVIGDQASTLNDFWGASKFIRNTFRIEDIAAMVSEVCGPDAILIKARHFPHQRMILFAVFKPNTSRVQAQHTIILGSFNRPRMVKRAIQSVLAQTVRDWQLVIADDGSNDDTIRSIHEETAGDPRIIFNPCPEPFTGLVRVGCSSRACKRINDALKVASGRIFHYLADDDWYDPKRFEIFNEIFADPAVHCGYGRVLLMNMDKVHGSIFPKSPCTTPLSNLDHNQVAHRVETFKVITEWPTEEKGDYALEGHYFNMLAQHWPFIGLDKIVAYKSYHPFNMQKTRDQSTSVREI